MFNRCKKWALVGQLFVLFEVVDQTHFLFWAIFDNFKATSDTLGIFSFKVILGQQIIQGKKLVLTQVHFFVSKKRQFLPRWLWAKLLADSSIFIFHRWFSHLEVLQKSVPSFFNWIYFRFWLFKLSIEIYVIYHLGTKSNVMGTILEFFDLHIWDKNNLKFSVRFGFHIWDHKRNLKIQYQFCSPYWDKTSNSRFSFIFHLWVQKISGFIVSFFFAFPKGSECAIQSFHRLFFAHIFPKAIFSRSTLPPIQSVSMAIFFV